MLNPRIDELSDYPFARLRSLLDAEPLPAGMPMINLSIGEPNHPLPPMVIEHMTADLSILNRYPTINGTPEFRSACAAWITRRYRLPETLIEPETQIVALTGTREGLYMIANVIVPQKKGPKGERPLVLMPNPFYQTYVGAAVAAGADPYFMPAHAENGFLPDFRSLDKDTLERTALVYICSPANPQGAVASVEYLAHLIELARKYDFVVAFDECYAEIYDQAPPPGGLDAALHLAGSKVGQDALKNIVVFHSLSKRSSAPGLRSGFCTGDLEITKAFIKLRNYGCTGMMMPVAAASAALWRDEKHVEENRALYRQKFDMAQNVLGNRFGFFRPAGGFYLWLDVGDPEAMALKLWREAALRTLPGNYLTRPENGGEKAGKSYLRIALVADLESTKVALQRIGNVLGA